MTGLIHGLQGQALCWLTPAGIVAMLGFLHCWMALAYVVPWGHIVPTAGRERFRFNVGLNEVAPRGTGLAEVIVSDFGFAPLGEQHR